MNSTKSENGTISESLVVSTYSSALTTASNYYNRVPNDGRIFYYEAIQINAYINGVYTFTGDTPDDDDNFEVTTAEYLSANETSGNDHIRDSYGCLYSDSFSRISPTTNLIACDDDAAGYGQFLLSTTLQADRTYVLVFTTYADNIFGSFSIKASGPYHVEFYPLSNQ